MLLSDIEQTLLSVEDNWTTRGDKLFARELKEIKQSALLANDQGMAKHIWCVEQALKVQQSFIQAYLNNKNNKCYEGWCDLERAEVGAHLLKKHLPPNLIIDYKIDFIVKQTEKFQSIYPYVYFMSPEFVKQKLYCSICDSRISIRNHCGHIPGEIYNGEFCGRVIKSMQVAAIAMVKNPVQKYSVPFSTDPITNKTVDHYNYALVQYLMRGLNSPFHSWDVVKTEARHPHSYYKDVGRNEKCPCGSDKKYKFCCLPTEGVLRPHYQFLFDVEPPPELLKREYIY